MPTYQITGDDGTVHKIDGPEGATREQVVNAIENALLEKETEEADKELYDYLADRPEPEAEEDGSFLNSLLVDTALNSKHVMLLKALQMLLNLK